MTVSELIDFIRRNEINENAELHISIDKPFQKPKVIECCTLHFEKNGLDNGIEINSHVSLWEEKYECDRKRPHLP